LLKEGATDRSSTRETEIMQTTAVPNAHHSRNQRILAHT